jgi:hypothetical protein
MHEIERNLLLAPRWSHRRLVVILVIACQSYRRYVLDALLVDSIGCPRHLISAAAKRGLINRPLRKGARLPA